MRPFTEANSNKRRIERAVTGITHTAPLYITLDKRGKSCYYRSSVVRHAGRFLRKQERRCVDAYVQPVGKTGEEVEEIKIARACPIRRTEYAEAASLKISVTAKTRRLYGSEDDNAEKAELSFA